MKSFTHTNQTEAPVANVAKKKESFFQSMESDFQPFFGPATIQPKLKIGEPDDQYEKQADRVADTVVQMKASDIQRQPMEEEEELQMKRQPILQRKCTECEEEEQLQRKHKIQAKSTGDSGANPLFKTTETKSKDNRFEPGMMPTVQEAANEPMIMGDWKAWIGNGEVVNNSSRDVTVWSSDNGTYTIPAHSRSESWGEDVDHVRDIRGQWWKIGWNTAVVDSNGEVSGAKCKSPGRGQDCGELGDYPAPGRDDTIHAKLKVNRPNDHFEQEADAVADKVINSEPSIQRKCAECEKEESLQKKENGSVGSGGTAGEWLSKSMQSSRGSGSRLPESIQTEMGQKIGADFSGVNIHTHPGAARMSRSLGARAFAYRNDIYFNSGEYRPETSGGKHLLAHELVHTVQQGQSPVRRKIVQREPLPSSDPIHDPLLDQFSAETGIPREHASQHSPEYRQWLGQRTQAQTTSVNIGSSCNRSAIIDIVNQSLTWLDDVYQQLIEYSAAEVFSGMMPPGSDHARISGALQQAFNTTDLLYAEVIRRRFLHMANMLRANGRISIDCNGQYCSSGGSSFTGAYVAGPYALTMCGVGTSGRRPIPTFIHELVHAIIPAVGISNDVTSADRVTDRAYRSDRVFQHLSPEETLDNADSYAILAELLHSRTNTQIVRPQGDTAQGCSQPDAVLEAFARADQWHHFALHELDVDLNYLNGRTLSHLAFGNLSMLNRAFPDVTSTAELQDLKDAFQQLKTSGFDGANWDFTCVNGSDSHCSDSVIYSSGGKVTDNSVTLQNIQVNETARICLDWFSLSADDRIRTIYAAFMLGRPSWIVSGFQLSDALKYADGAQVFINETVPAPAATSAMEHIESDEQFRRSQNGSDNN